jgi:hypothetical protein
MTLDEVLISQGQIMPTDGGEYVREMVRWGEVSVLLETVAAPKRAVWPEGVTPRGKDLRTGRVRELAVGRVRIRL